MYRIVFWTLWEKARVGWSERIALKHVYFHMWNRSPVQVQCMRQDAQGWCTGMTLRDGMGKEVGGGFRMGNTSKPMAYSCQCMAKPIQYCKVISLQLNKFIHFKRRNMYITICKIDDQCKSNAWSRALKADALGQPRRMGWGGRWEGSSWWGDTCIPIANSCWCMAKTITTL